MARIRSPRKPSRESAIGLTIRMRIELPYHRGTIASSSGGISPPSARGVGLPSGCAQAVDLAVSVLRSGTESPRKGGEMRALVIGGAGFIGHHLVGALLDGGTRWRSSMTSPRASVRVSTRYIDHIRLVEGASSTMRTLMTRCAGCHVVLHQAALPSVATIAPSDSAPEQRVNVDRHHRGDARSRSSRRSAGHLRRARHRCMASRHRCPVASRDLPAPESPYGVSKLAAEHYVRTLGRLGGIETVSLRYFNVFGPAQDSDVRVRGGRAAVRDRAPCWATADRQWHR